MKHLKLFFACLLMAVLSIGQVWATDYQLVTSTDDLEAGANYVIGSSASGSGVFMSTAERSNNRGVTSSITITDGKITGTNELLVVELGGESGAWTFLTTNYTANGYLTSAATGKNNHCKVVTPVEDCSYFTIVFNGDAATITSTGRNERNILRYNSSNNPPIFACYSSGQNDIYLYKEVTGGGSACATPTFSPAAGAVASGTEVSISCATDGAAIHYTTDGTDPTASSATYSTAIPVTSETTIKAIAVKAGLDNSSVASAAYTVLTPLTTMDQIFAAATSAGSTPTTVAITFNNWVVTGVKNSNAYVTDGTKGFIIYTSSHGFQVGDILSGTAVCKVQLYNGSAELTELTSSKVTVNTGGSVSPVVLDAEDIAALTGANTGSVIKISGACTYENNKYYIAGVQLYNQLYSFSVSAGTNYECAGVYVLNTTYGNEILPRSAADIVAQTSVANPTFSPAAGEYTEVQNVTLSCATDGATVYYTTDGTNPTNESTVYSSAIEVGASMTIKAIAYKGEDHSEVVSAAYTINLPEDENVQKTWDLSIDETATASEDALTWTATYVDMSFAKGTSTTNANNYYPGTSGQSYTSTRTYKNSVITITPASSKQITTVVFTATTSGYATTLKNASWTNATAVASDVTVTVTASGSGAISAVLGGTAGFSSVTVHYEPYVAPTTYAVSFAAPEHGSLAIANGEDPISSGDEFVAGTELTVTAEPASGYLLDAIKVIETGSDPENDVTSTVLSGSTLTVPAYAITVSATFVENVAPVATLTLSENGVEAPFAGEHHQGDVVNLPLTSSADCVKDFVGWSANASCAVAPEYAPGAEYTLASTEQTLYAVYATASGTSFVKTALADIASGSEVIVTETKGDDMWALSYNPSTSKTVAAAVSEDENILDVSSLTNGFWTLSKDGNNFTLTVVGGTDKLYCNNTNDGVRVGEEEANTFSINNEYLYTSATSDARYLGVYNATEFRCYTSINNNIKDQTLAFYKKTATYSDYATTCVAALADPVFTPAAGVYTEAKNVVITAEEGTIYYTTDGTDPTSASTEYTAPIVLDANGTTTIKAIAISATSQSAIVTAAYTINMPLSTMDQIFAAATAAGSTATDVNITFGNWVVSGVSTNAKNVFVTDGTKGFIIFDNGASMGFAAGDVLSGTVACKVQLYKGAAELTTLSSATEGLNIATGGSVAPQVKAISALSGINTGAPVTINSVQFDGEYLTDGVNSIKPFNSLFAYDDLENGKYYNVTGIYQQFDATKEILPRSAADIEEVNLEDPELSYTPASATIELGQSLPGTTFANPHELAISYSSNNEAVATVSNTGVIALGTATGTAVITASFAGNATYAPANVTYTITVNPASVTENVVILAVYDTKYYAMSTTNASSAFTAIEVEYDGSQVTVNSAEDKAAIQWTKKTSGDNTTFQDADSKYMKSADGTSMSLQDAVCNWVWDATGEYYKISGTTRTFFYQNGTGFKNFATSNIKKSGYSDKAQVIVIDPANIVITSKVSAELAYDPTSNEITQGGAWSAPTLVNPHSVTITSYATDNDAVATVTDGGVIALAGGIGTAHITAHFDGDASYLEGDAVYTITVNAPAPTPTGTTYTKVTSTGDITDGEYLIVYETTSVAFNGALETLDAEGNSVAVTINEGVIAGTTAIDAAVFTIDVTAGTLQSASGKYIGVSSNSNGLKQTEDASTYTHTFSIDEGGDAVILANFEGSTMKLRYNPSTTAGNLRFRYYKNDGQQAIQLYKKETVTPTKDLIRDGLSNGKWGTLCPTQNVENVEGAVFYLLSYLEEKDGLPYNVVFDEITGPNLQAGKPYFFIANAEEIRGNKTGTVLTEAGAGVNGFYGYIGTAPMNLSWRADYDVNENNTFVIYNNSVFRITGNTQLKSERCYININSSEPSRTAVPKAYGRRRITMSVAGTNVATGFENLNASEKPVKLMIDGNIYILRGEKLYDATGRLVK